MMGRVKIFSRNIRSGKTTELMHWCNTHPQADGILMPDVNQVRNFYFIKTKKYLPVQIENDAPEEKLMVGKFCFSKKAFDTANSYLIKSYVSQTYYFIIDEIGKLEVEQQTGLHLVFSQILQTHLESTSNALLLVVVRKNLLKNFLELYNCENKVEVIDNLNLSL